MSVDGGTTEGFDLARAADDDAKPLLSPSASSQEGWLGAGALKLLSDDPVLALGTPPRTSNCGRAC